MRGLIDLHCHWVASIDDGARSVADGIAMLRGLHAAGFEHVMATPHMRPGMFDNDRATLERAFATMLPAIADARARGEALPEVHLASEHWFDDVVFERLKRGQALPYPSLTSFEPRIAETPRTAEDADAERTKSEKPRAVLIEFPPQSFPASVQARLFDLKRAKLTVVLAHPERYQPVWKDDACLDPLLDAGAHLLLDVCSLIGKYGRLAQRASEKLLEEEAYEAACSDAHKPDDVESVVRAIERLESLCGREEAERLLREGPRRIVGPR
jgi:protein-tyrosine phosphatase